MRMAAMKMIASRKATPGGEGWSVPGSYRANQQPRRPLHRLLQCSEDGMRPPSRDALSWARVVVRKTQPYDSQLIVYLPIILL
jgi:hypothetical protein